jgi:hypothetical protein
MKDQDFGMVLQLPWQINGVIAQKNKTWLYIRYNIITLINNKTKGSIMGKQKFILANIIEQFQIYSFNLDEIEQKLSKRNIQTLFKKSLNKNDVIRKILNDAVLSNDEIVFLLRLIFNKD